MSVTFYATDPKSRPGCREMIESVDGPNWSNGSTATFLKQLGWGERELWGGHATIAEAWTALKYSGLLLSSGQAATFSSFLTDAAAAGATEIYWA